MKPGQFYRTGKCGWQSIVLREPCHKLGLSLKRRLLLRIGQHGYNLTRQALRLDVSHPE